MRGNIAPLAVVPSPAGGGFPPAKSFGAAVVDLVRSHMALHAKHGK